MKKKSTLTILLAIALSGCGVLAPNLQTPFEIQNPAIKGQNDFSAGAMINSTSKRYWLAYRNALEKNGYTVSVPGTQPLDLKKLFNTTKYSQSATVDAAASVQLWKVGITYSDSLCEDYFSRLAFSKAHRLNARRQTNIAGGVISAIMGLSNVSTKVVGGTGVLFSGVDSGFDAYDSSFLVTPDIALMKSLVREKQKNFRNSVGDSNIATVEDAIGYLLQYNEPCSYTGMQKLLSDSLNLKIEAFQYNSLTPSQRLAFTVQSINDIDEQIKLLTAQKALMKVTENATGSPPSAKGSK